ncbi:MAG: hypothetical protein JHC95_20965 [Solirubrobacteraceae bacterium]|nr:hypothetical protein [Solirubrobacteraceae bacterium]
MRPLLGLLAVTAVIAGCGDGGVQGAEFVDAETLTQTYTTATGEVRRVDSTLALVAVHPPASELPVALPAGTKGSVADIEITDEGADPFPVEWASFSARTKQGATLKEALRLPARRVDQDTQVVPVGFAVPDGDELASVGVRSIVTIWPFRAVLAVPKD